MIPHLFEIIRKKKVLSIICLVIKVDGSMMRIFYTNISDIKPMQIHSLVIPMKYFLKENKLSQFCVVQQQHIYMYDEKYFLFCNTLLTAVHV